ncbi:MAG: hypothetical protein ACMUHY_05345 [Thermoplasmatota archaeon]
MYGNGHDRHDHRIISSILLFTFVFVSMAGMIGSADAAPSELMDLPKSYGELDYAGLDDLGYAPRFPHPGSEKIQTPGPIPEDAVYPPDHSSVATMSSSPTRATWETYYQDDILTVEVDTSPTSRYPSGDLTTNEEQLLDRYIADFLNFTYPRVKDYYDPLDRISSATFKVWDIDGPSGVGGYYRPGTDEFNVDRSDLSWGGVITAHEFQHYIHDQYDRYEALWINEGAADYAAYLVYDITSATAGHVYAYLEYRPYYGLIVDDRTWQQDGTTAYYGNAFLYQLYMTHQYGGKNWSRTMIRETSSGTSGVTRALSSLGYSDDFMDSFQNWMAATRLNSGSIGTGQYEYPTQSYSYGQLKIDLTKTHSGLPITTNRDLRGYSITSIRFTSPPSGIDTFRMKMTFSAGTPMVGFYPETSSNRDITWLDFGSSRSKTHDFSGWGEQYNAFQLILSSTGQSNFAYDLDVLDLDPPVTTMSVSPRSPDGTDGWYVSPPKVTLSTESGSDTRYQIDTGIETDYVEPFWMPDGIHTLAYWSFDRHNNIEEKNLVEFKVDTVVPGSEIQLQPDLPEDTWHTASPLITLSSSHPNTLIQHKWGNDDFQQYEGPFLAPEGENILYWKAVDQAGNQEEVRSRTVKVDTIAPHLTYAVYPTEPDGENGWYVTNPQVTLSSYDAAAIYYAVGNGDLQPYLAPFTIPNGEHTLRITCTDVAGNDADEIRIRFSVDTIEPSIEGMFDGFVYTDENSSAWLNIPPILAIEGSEPGMEINYTINDGTAVSYEIPFEIPEGENEIWVRGKDKAGNVADTLFYLVKVDKRTPFVEHTFTDEMTNGWFQNSRASIELEAKDEDDRSSIIKIYYRWGAETPILYKNPVEIPEGISTFSYWAEDLAGNEMEPRSVQVKKDSTLPLIFLDVNGLNDGKINIGDTFTVDLTGSSDDSGIHSYSIDYYETGILDWTPTGVFESHYEESGTYEVVVHIKDAAGNIVNQSFTVVVEEEQAPVDISGEGGLDTGLLFLVIGIGVAVILLVIVLGVVLVLVRGKEAPQAPVSGPGTQMPPHRPHPNLPYPGHPPGIPPKPPVQPLPPKK